MLHLGQEKHINANYLGMNQVAYAKKMRKVENFFAQTGGIMPRKI